MADQLIGQLQISNGLHMGIVGKILVIGIKIRAQAVVMVEHGGNAVKAESVEVILRHPEFQVGQQEVDDLGFAVIKALGTPGGMITLAASVEKLVFGAIEHIDALDGIFDSVRVNHIQQNPDAHFMGLVYQILQILRLTEPGGGRKETGNLIAKAAIIGMLHDSHQLDGVIACLFDAGQHLLGELPIGTYFSLLLGHTHMRFVHIQRLGRLKILICPGKGFPVIHHFGIPLHRLGILHHTAGI